MHAAPATSWIFTPLLLAYCSWGTLGSVLRERPGFLSRAAPTQRSTTGSNQTCAELINHGSFFTVDVEVGTPGQMFSIVADTGSNTLIVPSCICRKMGFCTSQEHCFTGTNHSSSFNLLLKDNAPTNLALTFGSGMIEGVVAQEIVQVGQIRTFMKEGIMLMIKKVLNFADPFEGILGLGIPESLALKKPRERQQHKRARQPKGGSMPWDVSGDVDIPDIIKKIRDIIGQSSKGPADLVEEAALDLGALEHRLPGSSPPSFLEQSGLSKFSICFNEGTSGVLRLGIPPVPGMLAHGSVGLEHWGLDFRGISVGKGRAASLQICDVKNMSKGQATPCGAIPDSGTTLIAGPREQLVSLLESVCDGWPRCAKNHTLMVQAAKAARDAAAAEFGFNPFKLEPWSKGEIVSALLEDCDRWINKSSGLGELPPLLFHIAGSNGTQQDLEMPGYAYVIESTLEEKARKENATVGPSAVAKSSTIGDLKKVCMHAFSVMDYNTVKNGPVWILGSPFFYQFNVGYDLATEPPSISFQSVDQAPCGSCNSKVGLVSEGSALGAGASAAARRPRWVGGPMRGPSFDIGEPL